MICNCNAEATVTLTVEQLTGTMFVHDYALDGDEGLHTGKLVHATDGTRTIHAVVTDRDAEAGYWYLQRAVAAA